jgi:hypothetical protein
LATTLQDIGEFTVRLGVASAGADEEPAALLARGEEALAGPGSAADTPVVLDDEDSPQSSEQVAVTAG